MADSASTTLWITIITSAAVGAIVSAGIGILGQYLERRARRKELLLTKAIDLAFRRTDTLLRVADKSGRRAILRDDVSLAADYYGYLNHVLEHGELPESIKKFEAETEEEILGRITVKPQSERD